MQGFNKHCHKFSNELLIDTVKISNNFTDVCRKLGCGKSGGSYYNIHKRIKELGADISHFDASVFCRGKRSQNRKVWTDYLTLNEKLDSRLQAKFLVRSLMESGRKYICELCSNIGEWNGSRLVLQVDHINANWRDNRPENLRFLCPNCHSQTDNFRNNGRVANEVKARA